MTKTQQIVALADTGLGPAEIARQLGMNRESVRTLLWNARNPERARERWKLKARRYRARMTPEQRADANWRRRCYEAGVKPERRS